MKIKHAINGLLFVPFALCILAGRAGIVPQSKMFGASFTNEYYRPGVQLCDTGTYHGTWGRVPDGAAVAEEDADLKKKFMNLSADDGLFFTPDPDSVSEKRTCSDIVTIRASAYEDFSKIPVPTGARAAFSIYAPEGGKTNYLGWVGSQNCWTNLYPAGMTSSAVLNEWQEVLVRFLKLNDAHDGYVQYWLRRSNDNSFVPLTTRDGVSWIRTGEDLDTSCLGKIGFFGEGGLERIEGQEPKRGLIVGVGTWYDYQFAESIYAEKRIGGAKTGWEKENDPCRRADRSIRSYIIDGGDGNQTVTYLPSQAHSTENVEVTELEVQFVSANDDEDFPEDACARIRMAEIPGDKPGGDETCRFVCLANGQWKTNMSWTVCADAKYTIEISLLHMADGQKFVSYRYKEGYGLEGGAYRDLFLNEPMLSGASGTTKKIDFDGYGIVHEIRGKNRPRTDLR